MEPVNGYLSSDGKFFRSAEDCRSYENRFQFEIRRKMVVEYFSSVGFGGDSERLPKDLHDHIAAMPDNDLTELWNEHLLPLFYLDCDGASVRNSHLSAIHEIPDCGGSRSTTDPLDFFAMKATDPLDFFAMKSELAYRLLAFVLNKHS